jgi:hypothetical protein
LKHGNPDRWSHGNPHQDAALEARIRKLEDHAAALDETFKKNDLARRVSELEKK